MDEVYWGRFSPRPSVSPANVYAAKFSILIYLPWLIQQVN
jgi:hypothetical protein